tara:strand:+ start:886 stop:1431 length:546 start_codon:yes stop_codon:yes gene_type:complete
MQTKTSDNPLQKMSADKKAKAIKIAGTIGSIAALAIPIPGLNLAVSKGIKAGTDLAAANVEAKQAEEVSTAQGIIAENKTKELENESEIMENNPATPDPTAQEPESNTLAKKTLSPITSYHANLKQPASMLEKSILMKTLSGVSTLNKMADKDYDGDGTIESSQKEYLDSRDKAIKENSNK